MAWQKAKAPSFEQKDNAGALFKNKEKDGPTKPDYKGPITVNGKEYFISSWINKSKAGETYMALKVTPKVDPATAEKPTYKRQEAEDTGRPFDDDIPF